MNTQRKYIEVPIDAPSPLVGEDITAGRNELTSVRGLSPHMCMRRPPLTRLRFAVADAKHRRSILGRRPKATYASPTRGEGKKRAPLTSQFA